MKTHKTTWKKLEGRLCKKLGGKRTPLSGSGSGHTKGDCIHPFLYCEIKLRQSIPFLKTWNETKINAKKEKKIPMMIIHEKGKHNDIIMMDFQDFLENFHRKSLKKTLKINRIHAK